MAESEGEIEYLEEDEELVQESLGARAPAPAPGFLTIKPPKIFGAVRQSPSVRPNQRECLKRDPDDDSDDMKEYETQYYKRRRVADDSDYEPSADEERPKKHKRRAAKFATKKRARKPKLVKSKPVKKVKTKTTTLSQNKTIKTVLQKTGNITVKTEESPGKMVTTIQKKITKSTDFESNSFEGNTIDKRLKSPFSKGSTFEPFNIYPSLKEIKLHDFADAQLFEIAKENLDDVKFTRWNNLCRQLSRKYERLNQTVSHTRTIQTIRKIKTMSQGKIEMGVKVHLQRRSDGIPESFQALLPKFELDKNDIEFDFDGRRLTNTKNKATKSVTLLTKELLKDNPVLVVYSPTEFRSTTFEMANARSDVGDYIRMAMSCKMCVDCYQYSYRSSRRDKTGKEADSRVECRVCRRNFTSAYNLLSHIRTHSPAERRARKQEHSRILSQIVGYHYKCRICQGTQKSVLELRSHLKTHAGPQKFRCEVGHHYTN